MVLFIMIGGLAIAAKNNQARLPASPTVPRATALPDDWWAGYRGQE